MNSNGEWTCHDRGEAENGVDALDPREVNRRELGEQLHYFLREGYSRRERSAKELAAAEKARQYLAKYDNTPNGTFTLELSGTEYGTNETFRDTKNTKLEADLGRIIAAMVDAVPRQEELRAKREAEERARHQAEHRRWLEQERIRKEKEQIEKLLEEAERARRFSTLREYLERLERVALHDGELSESGREWLAEARRQIDAYDPFVARIGPTKPVTDDNDSDEGIHTSDS
jgi:hypothetical protein